MASYQIPQFLDSGEKILGPLNLRQFGYAIAGFFICVVIFSLFSPTLGNYAVIPAIPFGALAAYLALGRFNGRDSEIYVLKYILYALKPRQLVYTRVPDFSDLNEQSSKLTYDKIYGSWTQSAATQKKTDANAYSDFNARKSDNKIELIRSLSGQIDTSLYSAMSSVKRKELEIQATEQRLNPNTQPSQILPVPAQETLERSQENNFFNI